MNKCVEDYMYKIFEIIHDKTVWLCGVPLCHSGDLMTAIERGLDKDEE